MKNASYEFTQKLKRIGWREVTGLLLVGSAIVLTAMVTRPLAGEVDELRSRLVELETRRLSGDIESEQRSRTRSERVADFYASFPQWQSSSQWIGEINAAATRQGVQLTAGEYQVQRRVNHQLVGYQITLPVRASYLQVRAFLADVLENVPPVAIDEVRFSREEVDERSLDVRIRLTLYVGGD